MRHWTIPALLLFSSATLWAQNPFEPETNIGCVERLPMPAYTPPAIQARAEGTITASVLLAPKPTVQMQISSQFSTKAQKVAGVLMQAVETAIEEAQYRSDCAGKTVTLVFDFKISGRASANPKQSASFGYPNKFWIVTEPPAK